jgi:hypothetical protein
MRRISPATAALIRERRFEVSADALQPGRL